MTNIDDILLPLSSANEELEALSRKKFAVLFDESRFILKDETIDNGVDFRMEIIKERRKLGFGMNFQIKARGMAQKNEDGTYSKSIETKNIEYLLNNGHPAFYAFYAKSDDRFYFVHLNEILHQLDSANPTWETQPNHTIRFSAILDSNAVDKIYDIALSHGRMLREVNYRSAVLKSVSTEPARIVVDSQNQVTDDNEIRELIEKYGFEKINEAKWNEVLLMHDSATGGAAISARYCLIIAIAYYYNGRLYDAISWFKKAWEARDTLQDYLIEYLTYHFATTKYVIGLITESVYRAQTAFIEKNVNIGFYIALEKAKSEATSSIDGFDSLIGKIEGIMMEPGASENVKMLCRCDLILYRGYQNNMELVQDIAMINAREGMMGVADLKTRIELAQEMIEKRKQWYKLSADIREEAFSLKNYFIYSISLVNDTKVNYQYEVFTDHIYLSRDLNISSSLEKPELSERIDYLLKQVEESYKYFKAIAHTENIITSLSLKYELLHYQKRTYEAENCLNELDSITSLYDSVETKRKFEFLKNEGTTHETFYKLLKAVKDKIEIQKQTHARLVQEMKQMDRQEVENTSVNIDQYHVHLFPIGYFGFPKEKLKHVFDNLEIVESVQQEYENLLQLGLVPIVNLFYKPVTEHGYVDGYNADSIEGWERIYEARKFFYNNGYKRITRYDNSFPPDQD